LTIVTVQDQGDRLSHLSIYQQDDHLAVTPIRSVMRTGAIMQSKPRGMQVKCLHRPQTCLQQLLFCQWQGFITGRRKGQKGQKCIHTGHAEIVASILDILSIKMKSNLTHFSVSKNAYCR
jgi:hypothetical protein